MHLSILSRAGGFVALFATISTLWLTNALAVDVTGTQSKLMVTNLQQLRSSLGYGEEKQVSFRLEGVVCAAKPDQKRFFLQDSTATESFELDLTGYSLEPGQVIRMTGTNCCFTRGSWGFRIGNRLVVDNEGTHSRTEKSGSIYLTQGLHPIRLAWFNQYNEQVLQFEFSGPGIPRQKVPETALFRRESVPDADSGTNTHGLSYRCVEANLSRLPNFSTATVTKAGTVDTFDLRVATRPENVALEFSGLLAIPTAGTYTFYLNSDDGSQLFIDEFCQIQIIGSAPVPTPRPLAISRALWMEDDAQWAEVEGQVTFFSKGSEEVELEVTDGSHHRKIKLQNNAGDPPLNLLRNRVRAVGICRTAPTINGQDLSGALSVPGWDLVQVLELATEARSAAEDSTNGLPLLTTAEQVRSLAHPEAQKKYPVKLGGVLLWVTREPGACVIQDATRAIYARGTAQVWGSQPQVGDYCEIEGVSDPADFAPAVSITKTRRLGFGTFPQPMRPSWDQLHNGSLDSQYVELRGIYLGSQSNRVTLLTLDGKIVLQLGDPQAADNLRPYRDALIRMRGCFFPAFDSTRQVRLDRPPRFETMSFAVDEPAPANPFDAPAKTLREILLFDPRASRFQRVKVAGQIVHQRNGIYYMMNGTNGLRFEPRQKVVYKPGDTVEVVGFLGLGGSAPDLQEAVVRKTGSGPLPAPQPLPPDDLLNDYHDSTLVRVQGTLVDFRTAQGEQTLEIQVGSRTFLARVPVEHRRPLSWELGTLVQVTGVYAGLGGSRWEGRHVNSFELLLNSSAGVVTIIEPPWWTLRHLLIIVGVLLSGLCVALAWAGLLRRQVTRRTNQLKTEIQQRERMEHQRAIEQERSRIARDLHDELGSSLTEIGMLATTGPGGALKLEDATQRLSVVAGKSRLMVNALDELVWALNPQNDTVASLAKYVAVYAEEYLSMLKATCRVQIPLCFPARSISADVRHNLLLAVKEALANAVRHARATEILLRLDIRENELEIVIEDNGCGFDVTAAHGPGASGLDNLRHRMQSLGGTCKIHSSPGAGATVSLVLPLTADSIAP